MQHDADNLARYLAGQEDFIKSQKPPEAVFEHPCQRCQRPIKARFTHCWRCNNYLRTKEKLARECAS